MEQAVMEPAPEIRACRILVVAYDTLIHPPCRISWVGKDTRGSLPLYFSDLERVDDTGVIMENNGAARPFQILVAGVDRVKLRRILGAIRHYLMYEHDGIEPDSFNKEWRFKDRNEY